VNGTVEIPRFSTHYPLIYFDSAFDQRKLMTSRRDVVGCNEVLLIVFIDNSVRSTKR
jgi:hypothetical protein